MAAMYSARLAMDDSVNDIQSAATKGRLGLTFRSACCKYYFYTSTYRVEHSIPRPLARSDGLSILHQTLDLSYGLFCSPKTATLAAEEIVNGQSKMNCHCSLDLWSMGKDAMHRCQSSKKHRSTLAGSARNVSHVYPFVCLNSGAWARTTL